MQNSLRRSTIGMMSFLAVVYVQTSCLEAEERPVNFGPEVKAEDVIKVMREPMGKMDHNQIGKGEKLELTRYIYQPNIPNPQKYLLRIFTKEVIAKLKMSDRFRYKSQLTSTTWEDGKEVVKKNNPDEGPFDDFALFDDDASENTATDAIVNALGSTLSGYALKGENKVTFHQLESKDEMGDLPSKVKNKSNCANVPDCRIPVRTVYVVMVDWAPDGPVRHDLEFVVSGHSPFFSKMLRNCDTWIMKDDKTGPLLVKMCEDATDFDTGTNPWPATEVP